MPAYTGKVVKGALEAKGFENGKGDHHHLFLMVSGKRTQIRTKISHGRKTYTDGLWKCLKDQLKLDNNQLTGLMSCTLSYESYLDVLRDKNILPAIQRSEGEQLAHVGTDR
jgi:hypothetical protein